MESKRLIIRIQLMRPHNDFVSPQVFNRMFTMHGTTMIFFVAMPVLFGFANYLVPLMIGARDMAFPRLNAFSFWLTAFGGFLLYFSFSRRKRTLRRRKCTGRGMVGLRAVDRARVFAGSQLRLLDNRAAGLRIRQHRHGHQHYRHHPLHAMPGHEAQPHAAAGMAEPGDGRNGSDRDHAAIRGANHAARRSLSGRSFLRHAGRRLGSALDALLLDLRTSGSLHPDHSLLLRSSRKSFRYFPASRFLDTRSWSRATVCIGFVSMSVWAHHMFTIGMNSYANSFFAITTMAVGVPTGIKIFNWLGTMWGGKIQFKTPMLFCIGFLFQFLIAGLTGIMLAAAPFDWQLSGSYFVVAHFHYVIVGGILFALFAAFYYWYPKITGRMLSESLGKLHFWLFLIGFHLTFDVMHIPGIARHAAPHLHLRARPRLGHVEPDCHDRRIHPGASPFWCLSRTSSFLTSREPRPGTIPGMPGRWNGPSVRRRLPTTLPSIPTVASRRPLWDLKHPEDPDSRYE